MKYTLALTATLLTVTGCAADSLGQISPAPLPFCQTYQPVYTAAADTEKTKQQADRNNAVWLEKCAPQEQPAHPLGPNEQIP